MAKIFLLTTALLVLMTGCDKEDTPQPALHYYRVGMHPMPSDWRDTAFIVATSDQNLINQIKEELKLPVAERKMVNGALLHGNGGYNKNGSHQFLWHFDEANWELADFTAEAFDGLPYTDVDQDTAYWIGNLGRFSPWSSYIAEEITP